MKDIINKVILGMLFIAIPVAINIIYVMVDGTANAYIHGLMIYSTVFVFIIPIMLVETLSQKQNLLENVKKLHLEYVVCFMSIETIIYYGVFDNVAYLQADLLQHNLESYFTTFITQIKSAEGYDASYPIILVQNANRSGRCDFNDESAYYKEEIADLGLTAYSGELKGALPGYSAIAFMEYMCGFDAGKIIDYNQSLEAGKIEQIEEQQDMPCYPAEGSIRVIGDKIVIKLSDID